MEENKYKRVFLVMKDRGANSGEYIVGPLGIWPFPLLNALLQFMLMLRRSYTAPMKRRRLTAYEVVRDAQGRIVEIVEREVEQYE